MTLAFWPPSLRAPHKVTRPEQVNELADDMRTRGWMGDSLIGYWDDGAIQLLSGTHRRAAAEMIGIFVPVVVRGRSAVESAWGDLEAWRRIMEPAA